MASVLVDSEDDYRTSLTESKLETFRDGRHGMELTVGGLAQAYKTDGNLAEDLINLGIGGIGSVARGIVDMKLSVNGDHPSAKAEGV